MEDTKPNVEGAKRDAMELWQAGENKAGTNEERFNVIMSINSYEQLRLVFDEYDRVAKGSIEHAIKSEFSGDIRDGLLACVKCARNPSRYFAEVLYKSMKGAGTKDNRLIQTIVGRSEIDLENIKEEFQKMYGAPLGSWITDDTSGKYRDTLLKIVQGNRDQ